MILSILSAALAVAAAALPSASGMRDVRPRIVAFGDSLTSGHGIGQAHAYPAVLQQRLAEAGLDYVVVNAGVSGDTSGRALRRLDQALAGNVRVLILALGANDGLRGVPVAELKSNLARAIEAAQGRGLRVVLCGMEALPIYGFDYSVAFHNAYRELAAQFRVPLVPFMLDRVVGDPRMMQPDHVHPSAEGARTIAANIWPYLQRVVGNPDRPSYHG